MKKYGITKTFSIPLFLAVVVNDAEQSISFAMYQPTPISEHTDLSAWKFGEKLCLSPRGDAAFELIDLMTFKPAEIANVLSPKEIAPYNNVYFCMESYGRFVRPFNKMMDSYAGKEPGGLFLRRSSQSCFAQLLIPFPDSKWEDMALRLTVNAEAGYWLDIGKAPVEVGNSKEGYDAFSADVFPTIAAETPEVNVAQDSVTTLGFAVTPAKAGVRLYFKTDAGYLPITEVETDAAGKASVRFSARDLLPGDQASVEAGFKWVSNVARTVVKVA